MSYDLFLKFNSDSDIKAAGKLFDRDWYKVGNGQSIYENEDTGVYFVIDIEDKSEDEDPCDWSINVNFNRPSLFIEEVVAELDALSKHAQFKVMDPQGEFEDLMQYSSDVLKENYNKSNKWAFSAMRSTATGAKDENYLDDSILEHTWRWNYNRKMLGQKYEGNIFVPVYNYCMRNNLVKTFVVWPDCLPVALPKTDMVIVVRDKYAPRGFLGIKQKSDMCLVEYGDVESILKRHSSIGDFDSLLYSLNGPPADVVKFIKGLAPIEEKINRIAFDSVYNKSYKSA